MESLANRIRAYSAANAVDERYLDAAEMHESFQDVIDAFTTPLAEFIPITLDRNPDIPQSCGVTRKNPFPVPSSPRVEDGISPESVVLRVAGLLVDDAKIVGVAIRLFIVPAKSGSDDSPVVHHSLLRVSPDCRTRGIAPALLEKSILFYDNSLGASSIRLHTGEDSGRWYWPRCGFDFVHDSDLFSVRDWFNECALALGLENDFSGLDHAFEFAQVGSYSERHLSFSLNEVRSHRQKRRTEFRDIQPTVHDSLLRLGMIAEENGFKVDDPLPLGKCLLLYRKSANWPLYLPLADNSPGRQVFNIWLAGRLSRNSELDRQS